MTQCYVAGEIIHVECRIVVLSLLLHVCIFIGNNGRSVRDGQTDGGGGCDVEPFLSCTRFNVTSETQRH